MSCDTPYETLSAYVDGELDSAKLAALERHLEGCADCRRTLETVRTLSTAIRGADLRAAAGEDLRTRVQALATPKVAGAPSLGRTAVFRVWALAATFALTTVSSFLIGGWWSARSHDSRLTEAVVSSHMRSLLGDHLIDVASSDRHTVKPWFAGKVDFAPRVVDLADAGFPLQGGRLDVIAERRVAALAYQSKQHVINVFVWPANPGQSSAPRTGVERHGYALERWLDGGLEYWAVSDVEPARLRQFVAAWKARAQS